jgi:hypothetical protein
MNVIGPLQADLRFRLQRVPGLPQVFHWQGKPFERQRGVAYVQERLQPVAADVVSLGTYGNTRETFNYLVDIYAPAEGPLFDLYALGDAVRAHFFVGSGVGPQDAFGRVTNAVVTSMIAQADWFQLPVTITGFVHRETVS